MGASSDADRAAPPAAGKPASFRDDINALRGIAATVVVLFHFGIGSFSGGFVGVDIFFVISGLLMTQIIDRGIARGNFSIFGFYAARARRIIPALAVMCVLLVAYGALFLDPLTLGDLAHAATATLLFYSNMLYASMSGYFAEASETNWLLHTWTLSVEWQFYMLYPIALALAAHWKWLWERRVMALGIACVVCFAATVVVSSWSTSFQQYAFFLLPTRAFEMLAGGWLALAAPRISSRIWGNLLLAGGLAAIAFSVFAFDGNLPWPSAWMIFPIGGTVAVLAAARQGALWSRVPGAQALGTWSYSIYLWHWPFVVALNHYGVPMGPAAIAGGLAATLVCAILSYELVETRLRVALFGPGSSTSVRRWIGLALLAFAIVALTVSAWKTHGYEATRVGHLDTATQARLADYRAAPGDWKGMLPCKSQRFGAGRICVMGAGHPAKVAIIGDSHAEMMLPRLALLARDNPVEITLMRQQGCPPLPSLLWTRYLAQCRDFAKRAFDAAERGHYPRVMILSAWALYFGREDEGGMKPGALCGYSWRGCHPITDRAIVDAQVSEAFAEFAERLRRLVAGGARVSVVLPGPEPSEIRPHDYYQQAFFSGTPLMAPPIDKAAFLARTAKVRAMVIAAAGHAGAEIIDPMESRCGATTCPVFDDGRYIFTDTHHLRASRVVRPGFAYLDAFLTK
jgi:peptidoglycan/LPS O-acetylase OafA/YrhL